jgi:hypothetical protein
MSEVIRCVEKTNGESWKASRNRHGDGGRDMVLAPKTDGLHLNIRCDPFHQ